MITLKLTVEEVNYILAALCQRPFGEVNGLIAKVKGQAEICLVKSTDAGNASN